jgi:hypothetical protein
MFPWKSITKMPAPTFSLDFEKLGIAILVIDFQGKHFYELGKVSKSSKQFSLQFKTSLNSLRPAISEL